MYKLNIFKEQIKNFMAKFPADEWNCTASRIGEIMIFLRRMIRRTSKRENLIKLKRIFI